MVGNGNCYEDCRKSKLKPRLSGVRIKGGKQMNKQSKMSVSNAIMLVMALVLCVAVMFAACTPEQPTPQPSVTLKSIAVTTQPAKTSYVEGEKFDKAGMVVTAKYSDDTSKAVTNYTVSPDGALATTDKKVTIVYTEGETTVNAEVAITVTARSNLYRKLPCRQSRLPRLLPRSATKWATHSTRRAWWLRLSTAMVQVRR